MGKEINFSHLIINLNVSIFVIRKIAITSNNIENFLL